MTTPPTLASVLANPAAHSLATTFEDGDERRRAVVEAAARLLAEEGPHGLSLRRIAAEAGGSTQLVYTLFGGKPGLADALYAEGFGRLAAACRAALAQCPPPGDPERLMAIGRAYRAFAQDEPAFFAVMFGKAIPDFTPTTATSGRCRANTFGNLVGEVQACLDAGTLVGSAEELARLCWVTVHGLSALESAGMLRLEDPDAFVDEALRTPLLAHRP
ncbi:MAG TPA: TetR/AcrR family transcriptional regulator [Mycobacteriales bacterium]|nr:TetR/AcrR family transcriptional regulator [Mycobacteriales bacterium]